MLRTCDVVAEPILSFRDLTLSATELRYRFQTFGDGIAKPIGP